VTTILDPVRAPAAELAALYHERWEIEGALAELTRIMHEGWRTWCKPLIGHRSRLRDQNPADFGAHARQG
ncbi:MAG TPA: hypothetical protein VEY31_12325, partial [Roseococcus sp.]|nr:hypothetical protein [Roseococcus sp.]